MLVSVAEHCISLCNGESADLHLAVRVVTRYATRPTEASRASGHLRAEFICAKYLRVVRDLDSGVDRELNLSTAMADVQTLRQQPQHQAFGNSIRGDVSTVGRLFSWALQRACRHPLWHIHLLLYHTDCMPVFLCLPLHVMGTLSCCSAGLVSF